MTWIQFNSSFKAFLSPLPVVISNSVLSQRVISKSIVVVEFKCDPEAMVFPMVPAGASNDDLLVHPTQESIRERLA